MISINKLSLTVCNRKNSWTNPSLKTGWYLQIRAGGSKIFRNNEIRPDWNFDPTNAQQREIPSLRITMIEFYNELYWNFQEVDFIPLAMVGTRTDEVMEVTFPMIFQHFNILYPKIREENRLMLVLKSFSFLVPEFFFLIF